MESSINFNPAFGDISLIGNDIEIIRDKSKAVVQEVIQLFKTNKGDYSLSSTYGLNADSFIGKAVSEVLAEEIKTSVETALILNNIEGANNAEILYLIESNIIYLRIILPGIDTISINFLNEKGFEIE